MLLLRAVLNSCRQLRGSRGVNLWENVHLLVLYKARVMNREEVGQVVLVSVATSVNYLLFSIDPDKSLAIDTFSVRLREHDLPPLS